MDDTGPAEQKHYLAVAFWQLYEHEKSKHPKARVICFSPYIIGIMLIVVVLFDNFRFVIGQLGWFY
ncbi:MAG: hypothetical protein AAFZ92_08225 [Pseudomonadota bacterium]